MTFGATGFAVGESGRSIASPIAVAAQPVADDEMNWSLPCGKPVSKYFWIGLLRVKTCQVPSGNLSGLTASDRNKNTNQLLDTNIGIKSAAKWELAVANGTRRA